MYYRARYYYTGIGRFLSEDPLRFSARINQYAYVVNAPIAYSDPTGKCICLFKFNVGKLTVNSNCKGKLRIWVIDEETAPAAGAVGGRTVSADGFVLDGETYKIDGSTCVEINCSAGGGSIDTCVNWLACLVHGSKPPYIVPPGTFGGPPKEPRAGSSPPPVQ